MEIRKVVDARNVLTGVLLVFLHRNVDRVNLDGL
jgi:hypothetical protein